jgi:hypothetical protein
MCDLCPLMKLYWLFGFLFLVMILPRLVCNENIFQSSTSRVRIVDDVWGIIRQQPSHHIPRLESTEPFSRDWSTPSKIWSRVHAKLFSSRSELSIKWAIDTLGHILFLVGTFYPFEFASI